MVNSQLISVARGDIPADFILANGKIVNVFNGEIQEGNVAVHQGFIVGTGNYTRAEKIIDLQGKYLAPGFIDGHVHLESSMLDVPQYVRAVTSRGTTGIITDLHEIANVAGLVGMRYVLDTVADLPMDLYLMAPSCVPATHLESNGAALGKEALAQVHTWKSCIGLGEVMNYPGVIGGDEAVLGKITLFDDKLADGHAPGVSGRDLDAYIGTGIYSDHESVTLEEAREKLERGMYVMLREGSSEKNLEALLPLVTDKTYKRCLFVVDDRSCYDLLHDGDIDAVVRKAVSLGLDPVRAIQLATINTAEYFGLRKTGGIAPGYRANLIVIDDLKELSIEAVYYQGRKIAEKGASLIALNPAKVARPTGTVRVKQFGKDALKITPRDDMFPVIEIVPGQIITKKIFEKVAPVDGEIVPDVERDLLKAAVIERHHATGNIGVGLIKGFGLKEGALASSVAHDSHNIVAIGTSDDDIILAVKEIEKMQGGLVAVAGGKVLGSLPLPVAGLLSEKPLEEVVAELGALEKTAKSMGVQPASPFATLSFAALPVIPELRLTDLGIVDVTEFRLM